MVLSKLLEGELREWALRNTRKSCMQDMVIKKSTMMIEIDVEVANKPEILLRKARGSFLYGVIMNTSSEIRTEKMDRSPSMHQKHQGHLAAPDPSLSMVFFHK